VEGATATVAPPAAAGARFEPTGPEVDGARGLLARSARRRVAGGERVGVGERRRGGAERVGVRALVAGHRVLDAQRVLDVGGGGSEHPEAVVERAAIEHLDQHLPVVGVEEPQQARVVGAVWHQLRRAGVVLAVAPVDRHLEAVADQAQARIVGAQLGGRLRAFAGSLPASSSSRS
jgi:hypothetical protein